MSVAMCAVKGSCRPTGFRTQPTARLRHQGLADSERNWALAMHLSPFAVLALPPLVLAPLVLWLFKKDQSPFIDDHGREAVNMLLTTLVYCLLMFTLIAIPFVMIWVVLMVISMIRGAVAASNGEYFRYPMVIRFLS